MIGPIALKSVQCLSFEKSSVGFTTIIDMMCKKPGTPMVSAESFLIIRGIPNRRYLEAQKQSLVEMVG